MSYYPDVCYWFELLHKNHVVDYTNEKLFSNYQITMGDKILYNLSYDVYIWAYHISRSKIKSEFEYYILDEELKKIDSFSKFDILPCQIFYKGRRLLDDNDYSGTIFEKYKNETSSIIFCNIFSFKRKNVKLDKKIFKSYCSDKNISLEYIDYINRNYGLVVNNRKTTVSFDDNIDLDENLNIKREDEFMYYLMKYG